MTGERAEVPERRLMGRCQYASCEVQKSNKWEGLRRQEDEGKKMKAWSVVQGGL